MADSSDCTHVVQQKNPSFQGTVLDDSIDPTAVHLVKIDTITPHQSEDGELCIEDIIVLDDDRVVLLIKNSKNNGKLLQLFTREFDFLDEIDISSDVSVGCIAKTERNVLAWLDSPRESLQRINVKQNSKISMEFCSVTEDRLTFSWNGKNLIIPDMHPYNNVSYSYSFSNTLVYSGNIYGTLCTESGGGSRKKCITLFNKELELKKRIFLKPPLSGGYNYERFYNSPDFGFLVLGERNSRIYILTLTGHIQCYSFFGVLIWQVDDFAIAPNMKDSRVISGVAKVNQKLCCYLGGNELLTIDTLSKKTTTVKVESNHHYQRSGIALQLGGKRVLHSHEQSAAVYSLKSY